MNAVECLNVAFKADPNAIHALIVNRVPCNRSLADDPFIQVDGSPVLPPESFQVGALGLVNGVLSASGLPMVAIQFTDDMDGDGRRKILGFCEYKQPAETSTATQ